MTPIKDMNKLSEMKSYLKGKGQKEFALLITGLNTWLKLEDILQLSVKDVRGEHINIREISTRKAQRILINPALKEALSPHIENRLDQKYLFSSLENPDCPMSKDEALQILRDAAAHAGINEFDQDTLRKTFGRAFYKAGIELKLLQDILGEKSPESTLEYIGWYSYPFLHQRFGEVR